MSVWDYNGANEKLNSVGYAVLNRKREIFVF